LFDAAHGRKIAAAKSVLEEISHALELSGGLGLAAVAQAEPLQAEEVFAELRGSALGGGAGVVELVHKACGEGAKGDELLAMQRFNLIGLKPLRAVVEDGFADGRAAGEEGPEILFGKADKHGILRREDAEGRLAAPSEQRHLTETFAGVRNADEG
jgi:hypothetical protein